MELNRAIRKLIEERDIKIISSRIAYYYLSDLCPKDIYKYRVLFKLQEFSSLYHVLLLTKGTENDLEELSHNFSINTGFRKELIKELLELLTSGVRMAFFGNYPPNDNSLTLLSLYQENKKEWESRLALLKDGAFKSIKNGKINWILNTGTEILHRKYSGASNFSEGLVCINGINQFGLINIRGNLEIDLMDKIGFRAHGIEPIRHGLALGTNGYKIYYLINKEGIIKEVNYEKTIKDVSPFSSLTIIKENDLMGIIDDKCQTIIPPVFKNINNFNSGYSIAEYPNGKFAIINIYGNIINIKTKYDYVCLTKDRSLILGYSNTFIGKRINLINELGEDIQFPIEIKEIVNNSIPLLVIEQETNFFYFLNCKGLLFCKNGYEKAFPFNDCDYTWVKQGNYWYLIDKEGDVVSNTDKYEIISKYNPNGTLCRNKNNGNICVINKNICLIEEINNTSRITPKKSCFANYNDSSEYYYFSIESHTYKYIEGILYKLPFVELDIISSLVFEKNMFSRKSIKVLKGYPLTFSSSNNGSFYVFNIFTQEFNEIKLEEGEVIKKGIINKIDSYLIIEKKGKKYIISLSTKKRSEDFINYYPLYDSGIFL